MAVTIKMLFSLLDTPTIDARLASLAPTHAGRHHCRLLGGLKPSPLGDGFSMAWRYNRRP